MSISVQNLYLVHFKGFAKSRLLLSTVAPDWVTARKNLIDQFSTDPKQSFSSDRASLFDLTYGEYADDNLMDFLEEHLPKTVGFDVVHYDKFKINITIHSLADPMAMTTFIYDG